MKPRAVEPRDVKVSVAMITYNHERFIHQAIESVLMQQADFAVELIIGEDCSTDGTRAIVRDYGERYPDRIRLLLPERNLGMNPNFVAVMAACRGQYVALLEGDDYWTSVNKLERQADFLDRNPDFSICFHNVAAMDDATNQQLRLLCPADQKAVSTLEDLLRSDFLPTLSVMFRRGLFGEFPSWYLTMGIGDWPHHILNAQYGKIGYLNEVMGVYRQHAGGVFTSRSYDKRFENIARMYDALGLYFEHKYDSIITEGKRRHMAALIVEKAKGAPSFEEGIGIAYHTLDQWQEIYGLPSAWRGTALGRVYAYYLFASRDGQFNQSAARSCFINMARHDPSWLRNPGVWSIALRAFLGLKSAEQLRALASGARRRIQQRW
jgi:glycosyltransferase involved in cell wall biosynthesis